jgi:DHA3 family macrolide efflux protein-like MFS transporter
MENQPEANDRPLAPFLTIWTGQVFSLLGSNLVQFALIWWLTQETGSATVLAIASTMAFLPQIFLSPFAGALVDRWSRRAVMIAADGMIALATLVLAGLFALDAATVWHIYALMFVRSLGAAFHWPAMQASTSLMVPEKHLARIAGLNQALEGAALIVGPPLGALLLDLLPMQGVLAVDIVTALIAITPLLFIAVPQPRQAAREDGPVIRSVLIDMREGFRYVWGWPGLMALIGIAVVLKLAMTPAFSLIPLLVNQHFGGDAAQYSMVEAAVGIGLLGGGIALSAWGGFRRKIFTTLSGILILGMSFLMLGLLPGGMFRPAVGAAFIMGLSIPLIDGPIMAIVQSAAAPEVQGRVFTMMGSLLSASSPIALAAAGPVADWLGLQVWYLAAGIMCLLAGVVGIALPALVHIEENAKDGQVTLNTSLGAEASAR